MNIETREDRDAEVYNLAYSAGTAEGIWNVATIGHSQLPDITNQVGK